MRQYHINYFDEDVAKRPARRASFSARFIPTPGRDHGHTAMQMAQPDVSAKKGIHLSKSTDQRVSPRISFFSGMIASGGQASSQTRQFIQKSSMPCVALLVSSKGASVSTAPSRKAEPNSGLISEPCLPSSPKPALRAWHQLKKLAFIAPPNITFSGLG